MNIAAVRAQAFAMPLTSPAFPVGPFRFTNRNPVGTGPFTEVRVFQNQVYELGRNPRYWQPGRPRRRNSRPSWMRPRCWRTRPWTSC